MTRGGPGAADRELLAQLADQDLQVSLAQLERWRRAGLLPRHERHGLGRGRGSVSVLHPATVGIAAVLARHARQGRDLRWAVLAWFAEAGLTPTTPEPPDAALHAAVVWAIEASPLQRLLLKARTARTEHLQDAFYDAADRTMPSGTIGFDPAELRADLLAGRDKETPAPGTGEPGGMVHLIAVAGMGLDEVGPDAYGHGLASLGLFPQMPADQWGRALADLVPTGVLDEPLAAAARIDPFGQARKATPDQLRAARTVLYGLAHVGAWYLGHALLMPDSPAQAALRAAADEEALGPMLTVLAMSARKPHTFASSLITCLDPCLADAHDRLVPMMLDPALWHPSGDAAHFVQQWLDTLRSLT